MKTVFGVLVVTLFTLFSSPAQSDEGKGFDLQFGIGSIHAEKRADGKPWNEKNSGVAVQYITPGTLWGSDVEYCSTAGQLKNSEFGQTVYLGGCVRKAVVEGSIGKISIGAFAGVMTYPSIYNNQRKTGDLFPVVLPTASACLKNGVCLDATFVPKVQEENSSAAILFVARFPIKHW